MRIEPATLEDVPSILALERSVREAPHWAEAEYKATLSGQQEGIRRCLFVARGEEGLLGFAVGSLVVAEAELESVAVRQEARRRGLGRLLCEAVIGWARGEGAERMNLEVRASSTGAQRLYEGLGFVVVGRRPAYYAEPVEDALLMRRDGLPEWNKRK